MLLGHYLSGKIVIFVIRFVKEVFGFNVGRLYVDLSHKLPN